jgi:hypothetical protein
MIWAVAVRKLQLIDYAAHLNDLAFPPGNRLGALKRDRQGEHSTAAIRQAVAGHIRASLAVPDATADYFTSGTAGVIKGTVIDLGKERPKREGAESAQEP